MPLPRLKPPYAMICDWCEQVYWAGRLTSKKLSQKVDELMGRGIRHGWHGLG